ncbi:hypothetical protein RIF29_03566 [Crotalaria pallida]|uniref:Uncharacterized protein n=1 Tax=Crotalaria pallida TaxID=3830 RepID=A0AAN9J028_CROPI
MSKDYFSLGSISSLSHQEFLAAITNYRFSFLLLDSVDDSRMLYRLLMLDQMLSVLMMRSGKLKQMVIFLLETKMLQMERILPRIGPVKGIFKDL